MYRCSLLIAGFVLLALPATAPAQSRTWTDTSGRLHVDAEFVASENGLVTLRKSDGTEARLPLKMLSESDREYVKSRALPPENAQPRSEPRSEDTLTAPAPDQPPIVELRTWTDRESQRQLEARFVELRENAVVVQRADGDQIEIPIDRLSEQDQRYALRVMGQRLKAAEPAEVLPGDRAATQTDEVPPAAPIGDGDGVATPALPGYESISPHLKRLGLTPWSQWIRFPRAGILLAVGALLIGLNGLLARLLGRSVWSSIALGVVAPGLSTFLIPLRGEGGTLPLEPRSKWIAAMRSVVFVVSVAGLAFVVWMFVNYDTSSVETTLQSIPSEYLWAVLGVFLLHVLLVGWLAALLHRSVLGWYLLCSCVPFVVATVFAAFVRSRRRTGCWAVVCPLQRQVRDSDIEAMRSQGNIDPSAQVIPTKAIWKQGKTNYQWSELMEAGTAAARSHLPRQLRDITLEGMMFMSQSDSFLILKPQGTGSKQASVAQSSPARNSQAANASPPPTAPSTKPASSPIRSGRQSRDKSQRRSDGQSSRPSTQSLIATVTRPASLARTNAEVAELVQRGSEAAGPVYDAFVGFMTRRHPNAMSQNSFNYEGCRRLVGLLTRMRHRPAIQRLRMESEKLRHSNVYEDTQLADLFNKAADRIEARQPNSGGSGQDEQTLLQSIQALSPVDLNVWASRHASEYGPFRPRNANYQADSNAPQEVVTLIEGRCDDRMRPIVWTTHIDHVVADLISRHSEQLLYRFVVLKDADSKKWHSYSASVH